MSRLRLLFAAIALVLLIPVALIVRQTTRSMAFERAKEHEAVASRAFDEMQRALDDLLLAEEARPPGEYKRYYVPGANAALTRSPLADLPYPPYILGYFELDQEREFQTPLIVSANATDDERARRVRELRRLVTGSWPQNERVAVQAETADPPRAARLAKKRELAQGLEQKPSSTVALKGQVQQKADGPGVFESLKQIGKSRTLQRKNERGPRTLETSAQNVYDGGSFESGSDGAVREQRSPPRPARITIDVNVDPMVSRDLGEGRLALYRTVWSAAGSVRQGLVLDVDALGSWLREETLSGTDFAPLLEVRTGLDERVGEQVDGAYVFQHRFAEPFGALHAGMGMPVLPGTRDNGIWLLTALVVVAAIGGLFAAYRMVATRVAYAQRRSNFVSAVTHELKTPLTVIRMYSEMLENDMLEGEQKRREYYRTIGAESDRLGRLINNVLELSKIERGDRQLDLVTGDVRSVLADVLEMLRPHADATGFTLEVSAGADLPAIRYDRDALVQIVFNLVDNAMKYARDAANKKVVLEAKRSDDGVALVVRDFGPGVAAGHLKRVFEPFYRPENELTRTSKGTGIGLALVKSLAEGMGGSVKGRNPPGGGFEVTVGLQAA